LTKKTLFALAVALFATSGSALEWSDNSFRWSIGWAYREPGIGTLDKQQDISKQIISFTHVDGYKWGSQFLNIDMLISDTKDPAAGSVQGATEVYAVYRNTFSLNKISGTKTFTFPAVRDLGVVAGLDISTKNTAFAPHKVMPVLGLQLSFDVPGFLNFGILASKEWNNNGFAHNGVFGSGGNVDFKVAPIFSASWGIDLFKTGAEFEGFANLVLAKGKDGFGGDTKAETLVHAKLTYDLGTLFDSKGYVIGAGYEYWNNKFGNDASKVPGSKANSFWVEGGIHF